MIVIRADASIQMGSGHVMRCLTLADALRERGAEVHFVCRDLPGHLGGVLADQGYPVQWLPAPVADGAALPAHTAHSAWLGVPWTVDADQTWERLAGWPEIDWLIVDHYALDRAWESRLRPLVKRIMVIDDLADRPHDCELLLDQTLGRVPEEYDPLVPGPCLRLIGPRYALLRHEFAARREASFARRGDGRMSRILVLMGGIDADNTVSDVLEGLVQAELPGDTLVRIVMGSRSPHLHEVCARTGRLPFATDLRVDVAEMASLMVDTDLAISAGGLISYELTCMAVPSLLVPVSEIQEKVAAEICRAAEARVVEGWRQSPVEKIGAAVRAYLAHLRATFPASRRVNSDLDGLGTARVVKVMFERMRRA